MGEEGAIGAAERRVRELEAEVSRMRRELEGAGGQEALRASEERRRAVFDNILDVYYEVTFEGTLLEVSPSVRAVAGYRREDLLGSSIWDLYPSREEREALLDELRRHGAVSEYEVHLRDRQGRVVECAITARVREGAAGSPPLICGILRDISERVRAREALARANRELEGQVSRRAAELEVLVHALTHDLRTPLVAVCGFAGLLARKLPPEQDALQRYVAGIADAGEWMQALLDDLEDLFSPLDPLREGGAVDLASVARGAASVVEGQAGGGPLRVEVAPALPRVRGDGRLIRRILENLLSNAVKYMGGQPRPLIRVGARAQGGEAVVWVADNGAGIPPGDRERVFEIHERLGARVEGSGLGLAIVRRFVEAHGGRAWVEAGAEGKGSTFLFTLPLADPEALP